MPKKESKKVKSDVEVLEENLPELYKVRRSAMNTRDAFYTQLDTSMIWMSYIILMFSIYTKMVLIPLWILSAICMFSVLATHLIAIRSHEECIEQINKMITSKKVHNIKSNKNHRMICKVLNGIAYTCFVLQFIALIAFYSLNI